MYTMFFAPNSITLINVLGAIPALGGSKIIVFILPISSGLNFKNFPTSEAKNYKLLSLFLIAFLLASSIASEIISTPITFKFCFRLDSN